MPKRVPGEAGGSHPFAAKAALKGREQLEARCDQAVLPFFNSLTNEQRKELRNWGLHHWNALHRLLRLQSG